MSTIQQLLRWGQAQLGRSPHSAEEAASEAQILLAHVLGQNRTWLFTWSDREPTAKAQQGFEQLIAQRQAGHPIAYLTGRRAFWNLQLQVDNSTLIPRPETELLVEQALQLGASTAGVRVLELGTGSGAIVLALASERPAWQFTACERSPAALRIAQRNAQQLRLDQITWLQSDWFSAVQGRFDLILSNPPYIAEQDSHLTQGDLRFEPRSALASGDDGLHDIRQIVAHAGCHLRDKGWLLLEHGYEQGQAVRTLLQEAGFQQVFTKPDLAGQERLSGGQHLDPQGISDQD